MICRRGRTGSIKAQAQGGHTAGVEQDMGQNKKAGPVSLHRPMSGPDLLHLGPGPLLSLSWYFETNPRIHIVPFLNISGYLSKKIRAF